MSDQDLFLVLVAANPVRALERSEYGDETMLARIIAAGKPNRLNTPRIRRGWVIGGISVMMVTAAAYAVLSREAPDDATRMMCYSELSADPAQRIQLATSDPIGGCQELWQSGQLGARDVPPLTACITEDGIIAVVPGGDQACADLGFSLWRGSFDNDEQSIIDFQDEVGHSLGLTCYTAPEGQLVVEALLNKYGLDGWTIVTNDDRSDSLPCTASAVDTPTKTVTVYGRLRTPQDSNPKGP